MKKLQIVIGVTKHVLCLVFCGLSCSAFADESFWYEEMKFEARADGSAAFLGYAKNDEDLVIPEIAYRIYGEWGFDVQGNYGFTEHSRVGYRVTELAQHSTVGSAKNIVLPDTVVKLSEYAFGSNVESVRLSKSLTSIPERAFDSSNVRKVSIPEGIRRIGAHAFYSCTNLTEVEFWMDRVAFGSCVFQGCTGLKNIALPRVDEISFGLFSRCSALQGIEIPYGCTNIEESAFSGCHQLLSVNIPDTVCHVGARAFLGCVKLSNISLGAIGRLKEQTFAYCSNLVSVTVSAPVCGIGRDAFLDCVKLCDFNVDVSGRIGQRAFGYCTSLKAIDFLDGVTDIEDIAFIGCFGVKDFVWPIGLTNVAEYCLYSVVPSRVVLSKDAKPLHQTFYDCSQIQEVTFDGSWRTVEAGYAKESLRKVTFEDGVVSIGSGAFKGAKKIEEVDFPKTLQTIGNNAFSACTALRKVSLHSNVDLKMGAFDGCVSLTDIDTKKVKSVMQWSFGGCSGLRDVYVHSNMYFAAVLAFDGCTGVENLTIETRDRYSDEMRYMFGFPEWRFDMPSPKIVKTGMIPCRLDEDNIGELHVNEGIGAGSEVLYTPRGTKKVFFPKSLTNALELAVGGPKYSVHSDNPRYCNDHNGSLRSKDGTEMLGWANVSRWWYAGMVGEDGYGLSAVKVIGERAFQNCDKLSSVCIDTNITSIGKAAFKDLPNLSYVSFGTNVASIGESAFEGCISLRIVSAFPRSLKRIGRRAFANCPSVSSYTFEGKPPSVTLVGTNEVSDVFAENRGVPYCYGYFYQGQYEDWTNKVDKIGMWQGLKMVCLKVERPIRYSFGMVSSATAEAVLSALEASGDAAEKIAEVRLVQGCSERDLLFADIMGVKPTLTRINDAFYVGSDVSFKIEAFDVNVENRYAKVKVAVSTEKGILPESYDFNGLPDIQVSNDIGGAWINLNVEDRFILVRENDHRATLSATVDLRDYRFVRAIVN